MKPTKEGFYWFKSIYRGKWEVVKVWNEGASSYRLWASSTDGGNGSLLDNLKGEWGNKVVRTAKKAKAK